MSRSWAELGWLVKVPRETLQTLSGGRVLSRALLWSLLLEVSPGRLLFSLCVLRQRSWVLEMGTASKVLSSLCFPPSHNWSVAFGLIITVRLLYLSHHIHIPGRKRVKK